MGEILPPKGLYSAHNADPEKRARLSRRDLLAGAAAALPALSACNSAGRTSPLVENPAFASAIDLAGAIRAGEISSEAVGRACLERIEEVNPHLNAVVLLRAEAALAEARKADQALARGKLKGALHAGCP